jgi:RNA polymerase sigma-70 factor (ECF subfamily)
VCNVFGDAPFIIAMTAVTADKVIMRRVEPPSGEAEQDLLIIEARGDREAFSRLYRMHYEMVFRYCSRRLFHRHAAEDVTSNVFFKVVRNIGSFEGDRRGFRNWLYRIATNAVNDHLRSMKKRKDALGLFAQRRGGHGTPVGEKDQDDLAVKQAILDLNPKYQAVITLHYFERMKLTEIAEILGQNPATIRSQLSRALNQLRKTLKAATR